MSRRRRIGPPRTLNLEPRTRELFSTLLANVGSSGCRRGLTLLEVMVAAVIATLIVTGTLSAFNMGVHMAEHTSGRAEASYLAEQGLERLRNSIACRQGAETAAQTWYNATCVAEPTTTVTEPAFALAGPGSITGQGLVRKYTATPADCDGINGTGDCYQVSVTVSWNPPQ
ncbi:MAG: prepilin-type N-terminal cleavage/methylation domain-containing protein [Candidatus Omnitrophica bacterium]|nr:prepilin-type N-terminal cleavage/methylation domain-containing protein [Candidatus Omnitrophota bacterium]